MKLTLTLTMDNEAFHPYQGAEVARILEKLAKKVMEEGVQSGDGGRLVDYNGNVVGEWTVTE